MIHELNKWIKETAERLHIPLADTNNAVADPNDKDRLLASSDGGDHPDISGYRAMAVCIAETVEKHLSQTQVRPH